jgi:hypothetical protein
MATDRKTRLQEFVGWSATHITGDEKGEAQIFLDRLLQAFSQKGVLETGKAEFRIRKPKEDGGGTAFADFVWKPLVLIEMKKRGADMVRTSRQAFRTSKPSTHRTRTIAFGMPVRHHGHAWD